MQFKLRELLLILVAFSALAAIVYYVNTVKQTAHNAYAVWWVAGMVVNHLEANDGRWPSGWDDLRDDYATSVNRSGRPWQFDELVRRVQVDWNANPDNLIMQHTDGVADFRVIWARNGSDSYWDGHEPNQTVLDYLNVQLNQQN